MTADLLNRTGLILGLISGLLLTHEVIKLIPIDWLEGIAEKYLNNFESWLKFPLKFGPPSWKRIFSEEQRDAIEPITAILGLIHSIIWISTLAIGLIFGSKFFILLSLTIIIATTLRQLRTLYAKGYHLNVINFILAFFFGLLLLITLAPGVSLIRVIVLILRALINRVRKFFSTHKVLENLLIIFAIVTFILSNILQFIATFYD
jgi:hypothetical protein